MSREPKFNGMTTPSSAPLSARLTTAATNLSSSSTALRSLSLKLETSVLTPSELSSVVTSDSRTIGSALVKALLEKDENERGIVLSIIEKIAGDKASDKRCLIDTVAEVEKSKSIWSNWTEQARIEKIMSSLPSSTPSTPSVPPPAAAKPLPYMHVQAKPTASNPTPTPTPYSVSSLSSSLTTYLYTSWAFPDVPLTPSDSASLTAIEVGVGLRHDMGKLAWELTTLTNEHVLNFPPPVFLQRGSIVLRICECLGLQEDVIQRLAVDALEVLYNSVVAEFDGVHSDPNLVGGQKKDEEDSENR